MKKISWRKCAAILLLVLAVISSGCSQQSSSKATAAPITLQEYMAAMPDQEKNWMNLTPEQYLDDFETLYQEMKNNYPYFGVALRKYGVDIDKQYEIYKEKIKTCTNDDQFWNIICDFVAEMEYTGHLTSWGYRYSTELENTQDFIEEFPEYADQLKPYIEKLDNPVSKKNYSAMEQFYTKLENKVDEINGVVKDNMPTEDDETDEEEYANATTKILEENKVAYIKINMFNMDELHADQAVLYPFYDQIKNYDHLIIDITDNPGGGMGYFNQLVVAPLIDKKMEVTTYQLIKDGDLNLHYLRVKAGLADGTWQPVSALPTLPELNKDDLADMTYFTEDVYAVEPMDGQGFHGQIWLLVNEGNYSSSEYAAMFAKQTGFATLVGNQTGGDGIGTDPTYIILPHSGIVVQYSPIYGMTSDGRSSEEFGTTPDILSPAGESPLDTCLKAIKNSK